MPKFLSVLFVLVASIFTPITPASAAYAFTTHTFTPCGQTGQSGPSQASCRSAYSTTWDESDTNFTVSGGIQIWTVPYTGLYRINAYGAAGSAGNGGSAAGGKGAQVQGDFNLVEGDKIRILVGQMGVNSGYNSSDGASGSGGGGTFVISGLSGTSDSQVLLIAAGGGGSNDPIYQGSNTPGMGGLHTSSGTGEASNLGGSYRGNTVSGASFANGGAGGYYSRGGSTGIGGFGGGGATDDAPTGGGGWLGGTGSVAAYSKNNGANQSGISSTNSGAGSVAITSLGPSVTTFAPAVSLTNSANLSFNLIFSQSVTGVDASDFTAFGTGSSTCTIGAVTGSGTTYAIPLTGCSQGTVSLTITANVATNGSSQTGPASNTNSSTAIIDTTAPTISSVSPPSNTTYIPGNALNFTVNFSESVTVTGSPRLTLTVGSLTKYATFVSLTDSKTATFRYTVATATGEFDTDGIAVSTTLDLNSGAIADLATNALSPLTFTAPTLTSVLVAQTPAAPTITSITPSGGTLSVAFTAGEANGSAISNYQYSTDNGTNWKNRATGTTASPLVITTVSPSASSLSNGTAYNVRIRAVNGAGSGESSTAVSATPSAVVITGDATLTTTYGSAASTGTYTSAGGTGPYTYTLSATPSGVSISGGVVTASSSTTAGTYTQNVISTDSASQTGLKQLVITVNKASTTISISLPSNATDAALGGAITITATVSQAGAVNFKLGGSSISGCSSVTSSAGSATCSWTPGALGAASLTAVLTPTDSTNYENATTSTLSITVVNGVTTVSLALAGGVTQTGKGQNIVITATVDQVGRISFFADGKRIPGCFNKAVSGSTKTCTWKPAIQKQVTLTSRLVPTNNAYSTATESMKVWVVRRTGAR
jgi:hypothetical protein